MKPEEEFFGDVMDLTDRVAHTTVTARDGRKFAVSDSCIRLCWVIGQAGGVVCRCGAFTVAVDPEWGQVDDSPCCPKCMAELVELSSPVSRGESA